MSPLIGKYMEVLETAGSEPEDLVLLADLLADPRVHYLPKAWVLPRKLSAAQLSDLLPAAVQMLATAPESASPESSDLGERLAEWPHAAFANPSPEMRRLLADPIRRRQATGLIARLSDMGASGAPIAADIMTWHAAAIAQLKLDDSAPLHEKQDEFDAHFAVIDAGRIAMCRLGPVAASQLPHMLALELSTSPRGFERREWDRMTLRLGTPLTEIETPLSGTNEQYREGLAHWLARFDLEKSCE